MCLCLPRLFQLCSSVDKKKNDHQRLRLRQQFSVTVHAHTRADMPLSFSLFPTGSPMRFFMKAFSFLLGQWSLSLSLFFFFSFFSFGTECTSVLYPPPPPPHFITRTALLWNCISLSLFFFFCAFLASYHFRSIEFGCMKGVRTIVFFFFVFFFSFFLFRIWVFLNIHIYKYVCT